MREEILGVCFDPVTLDEAADRALEEMARRRGAYVCTPNPEIVMLARRDEALARAIRGAALVLPDGTGIVWAAKKMKKSIPERVAGYDFLMALLARMTGSVFILGGRPGAAEKAADAIRARFPRVEIAGCCHGYFTDDAGILEELRRARPSLVLVCLGAPRQELWMASHRVPGVGLMAGLGGSVDVLAGTVRRAPPAWRERGLEWLYRLLREPRRLKRQLRLAEYALLVLGQRNGIWKKES